ncbi:MAG: protein translocase subunit SecF [Acidimicrobiales bacterium]
MSTITATLDGTTRESGITAGFRRLYYGQTKFDFVRRKRIWFLVSGLVILAGVISLATQGLNFDIEFVGGTSWQIPANGASVNQARTALAGYGLGGATITMLGTGSNQTIQVEAKLSGTPAIGSPQYTTTVDKISAALAKVTHHKSGNAVTVQEVGPTWGSQITHKAVVALIVFFIMIAAYISIFFEWKMALAAIIAVIHDILVTIGIYSLTSFLVTPDTVVAFLTILGYSLYDTIVVFDRVRDNTKGLGASGKLSFTDVVNLSMNQTLARSINTSAVAIMPILAVLVLGADILGATTLQYFGLALLIGLSSGAYSSIFIASPLVAILKEREPRYRQIRERLENRGAGIMLLTPAAVAGGVLEDRGTGGAGGSRRRRKASGGAVALDRGPIRPSAGKPAPADDYEDAADDYEEMDDDGDAPAPAAAVAKQARPSGGTSSGASRSGTSGGSGGSGRSGGARSSGGQQRPAPRPRKRRRR